MFDGHHTQAPAIRSLFFSGFTIFLKYCFCFICIDVSAYLVLPRVVHERAGVKHRGYTNVANKVENMPVEVAKIALHGAKQI